MHEAVIESIEHLRPWMPWIADEPQTLDQRRALVAGWQSLWDAGDRFYGMFVGDEAVGGCGLHARIGAGGLEIGYWVRVGRTGRGYATAASRQLTDLAFADPGDRPGRDPPRRHQRGQQPRPRQARVRPGRRPAPPAGRARPRPASTTSGA